MYGGVRRDRGGGLALTLALALWIGDWPSGIWFRSVANMAGLHSCSLESTTACHFCFLFSLFPFHLDISAGYEYMLTALLYNLRGCLKGVEQCIRVDFVLCSFAKRSAWGFGDAIVNTVLLFASGSLSTIVSRGESIAGRLVFDSGSWSASCNPNNWPGTTCLRFLPRIDCPTTRFFFQRCFSGVHTV